MKPFKPPTLVGRSLTVSDLPQTTASKRKHFDAPKHTAFKKARIQASHEIDPQNDVASRASREPLQEVPSTQVNQSSSSTDQDGNEVYYSVLWYVRLNCYERDS